MRLFIALIVLLLPIASHADKVISIPNSSDPKITDIIRGFFTSCDICIKKKTSSLDDTLNWTANADGVLAIGPRITKQTVDITTVPVFATMITERDIIKTPNHYSLLYQHNPADYIAAVQRVIPNMRRIAMVYSKHTAQFVRDAISAAPDLRLRITATEVSNSTEAIREIAQFGLFDAVILLPDPITVNDTTLRFLQDWTLQSRVPVVSFSRAHLRYGATMSFEVPYYVVGQQIGRLARAVLLDKYQPRVSRLVWSDDYIYFYLNKFMMKYLNLEIPKNALYRANGLD